MSIHHCRVCGHSLKPLLQYDNMPRSAQFLPLLPDKGITLKVLQCLGCGLVQLNNDPVSYYETAIRTSSPEMEDFRIKQKSKFVQKYCLVGKKIIEIDEISQKTNVPFDAFLILNYLEHLPDINSVLMEICNNLSDGGVGIVEVPNFDMIIKENLFSEFIIDHLFYFTKETLETTLKLNGFDIIESKVIWHDYIISTVVRKRKELNLLHFYKHQKKITKEIENYIARFKKVAVWGAGHQALTVLSLINSSDKIRYVIDSTIYKQGKFTPVTHIPIVSPDVFHLDPVNAIIVMASSYSDEVVKGILQRMVDSDKYDVNIAILREYGLQIII